MHSLELAISQMWQNKKSALPIYEGNLRTLLDAASSANSSSAFHLQQSLIALNDALAPLKEYISFKDYKDQDRLLIRQIPFALTHKKQPVLIKLLAEKETDSLYSTCQLEPDLAVFVGILSTHNDYLQLKESVTNISSFLAQSYPAIAQEYHVILSQKMAENHSEKLALINDDCIHQHIVKEIAKAIYYMQEQVNVTEAVVDKIYFSSVPTLKIREQYSLDLEKTIYEKVGYPSNKGGFEKAFMEYLDNDAEVSRFIKINEYQHSFASICYIRQDGLLATYHPDFMVCTDTHIYIVETKGQEQVHNKNVRQKQLATVEWCRKINQLHPQHRMERIWEYVLLGEEYFYSLQQNGANFTEMCELHKVSESVARGTLF